MFGINRRKKSVFRLAIVVSHSKVRFLVSRQRQHPELIVNDVVDVEQQSPTQIIDAFSRKYKNLDIEGVPTQLVLAVDEYESVLVEKPAVQANEIANSLKYSLKDLISYSADNAAIDYYELPFQPSGQNKIVALATSKERLAQWVEAIHKKKWQVFSLTASETVLPTIAPDTQRGVLVLYENGENGFLVQIYQQQQLVFSRLLRSLNSLSNYSLEELQAGALESLATEVQRSMDYYESQLKQAPVSYVVCAVEHQQSQRILTILGDLLAIECELYQYPSWAVELCEGDFSDLTGIASLANIDVEMARTKEQAE